ncbi:MAG: hypothetical protein U5L45_07265 [Saprospiraceae bacterium]|nr:hypothetical protein [Saprospiraceae bacterium]
MVRFSASPKNEPHSPPSRERSEREMQKTLLGYAYPSYNCLRWSDKTFRRFSMSFLLIISIFYHLCKNKCTLL